MSYINKLCREAGYHSMDEKFRGDLVTDRLTQIAHGIVLTRSGDLFEKIFMKEGPQKDIHIFYDAPENLLYFHFPDLPSLKEADKITRQKTNMDFEVEMGIPPEKKQYLLAWLNLEVLPPTKKDREALEVLIQNVIKTGLTC